MSLRWWPAAVAVSAATVLGLIIAHATVGMERVPSTANLISGLLVDTPWLIAGLIAWRLRPDTRIGAMMVAVGLAYAFPPLASAAGPGAYPTWVGTLFSVTSVALLAHLLLAFPSGVLEGRARFVAAAGYFAALALQPLTLIWQAYSNHCPACGPNPFLITHSPTLIDVFNWPARIVAGLVALATLAILFGRWRRASKPARRVYAPLLWTGLLNAAVAVVWLMIIPGSERGPVSPTGIAFGLIPIAFLIGLLRMKRHRSVVADLVVELGAAPPPGRLRDALARTLGDPTLELAFWLPDAQRYVAPDGSPTTLPEPGDRRAVSVLRQRDEPLAALIYDPALLDDPKLLAAVSAAARLALENSRLQADLRAQLLEVRASRARIVSAGDSERRRIERNLHDGAQQRLLGVRLGLRLARGRDPAVDALLDEIDGEVDGAIEELRDLARGLHPAVLQDEGLGPALATLARRAAIPVDLAIVPEVRFPEGVEAAAYYVAAETLANVGKHAHATRARIELTVDDGHAAIEIADDGCGGAGEGAGSGLQGLRDRVEALDGRLSLDSPPGAGTRVRATFPVA